jgi:hypothetical protein
MIYFPLKFAQNSLRAKAKKAKKSEEIYPERKRSESDTFQKSKAKAKRKR